MDSRRSPFPNQRGPRPQSEYEERVVQIDRVARVQKGGRRFRFRATVVVGDRKGKVGLGIAKAQDVQGAIRKAVDEAKKDFIQVPTIDQTIPFELVTTFTGAKVLLKPARKGTGIIAGGAVRPVIELSGITNILSKSLGSNNRINNAKAALKGLQTFADTDLSRLHPKQEAKEATEAKEAKKAKEAEAA
ncbi:MAG: 30S ribosomal protein S5 [bacterium]|nr:30S ribosomal protein S5 [bacterium]